MPLFPAKGLTMQARASLSFALFLLAVCASSRLLAQFQPPTPDELKMTADPKAPGASAVYLYREDVIEDSTHSDTIYERIKVLSEKGKDLATVHVPYVHGIDTVSDIQGRTIHADGTIIPLTAKPADLMAFKSSSFEVDEIVFTLPNAEVGSILEYRLILTDPPFNVGQPIWQVQTHYFVHKEHFQFHDEVPSGRFILGRNGEPLDRLMALEDLPAGVAVSFDKSRSIFTLDLSDVAALPDEDWTPPLNILKWRVEFYYTNAKTAPQFWATAERDWAKDVEEFTHPSGALQKVASGLISPSDTDDQKARKIYAAVQKLDNTAFSRTKSKVERKRDKMKDIHQAEDIWKNQSGDEDEITLLFIALARAAGLKVLPVQVVNRNRAMFDGRYLSTRQLDDYLADVLIDGKDVYLDPGQKMCPYGALHWKHTLASGFKLGSNEAVITPEISFKSAVVHRVADLAVDSTGNVKGIARYAMTGPDALRWRQLSLENDQDEVKKQFKEAIKDDFPDGVQADFDHFQGLDDPNVTLVADLNVSGTVGSVTGKHFFMPGLFFESRGKHPFVASDKRFAPVDVHFPKLEQDDVTYHLPPGFSLEGTPLPSSTAWPEHALLKISSTQSGSDVKITRSLAYNFTLLDPKDYSALHDFYLKVATADQQQFALTRTPPTKGN
jgi:hypothetical protein